MKKFLESKVCILDLNILNLESQLLLDPCSERTQEELKVCHASCLWILTHKEETS